VVGTFIGVDNNFAIDTVRFLANLVDTGGARAFDNVVVLASSELADPALNIAAATSEDTPVDIQLLGDAPWGVITVPEYGSLGAIGVDGIVTYTPNENFSGSDLFTYSALVAGEPKTGTVSITVAAINDAPVATDDEESIALNLSVVTDVLANDSDADGDALVFVSVDDTGTTGTVVCSGAGVCTYKPAVVGADSYSYTISDGTDTAVATVSIEVLPTAIGTLFADDFNREAGPGLGNSWHEAESPGVAEIELGDDAP
jgi:hypothetical protein